QTRNRRTEAFDDAPPDARRSPHPRTQGESAGAVRPWRRLAMSGFPFFEVVSHETGLPVSVVVWHVRSVRPIREKENDDESLTRIELTGCAALDCDDSVSLVRQKIREALQPVTDWLAGRSER